VPGTCARSTLFSEAILRTSGDERGRSPAEAAPASSRELRMERQPWQPEQQRWLR
jgi:hypothetical protein